jgi:hypothetical protein
VSARTDVEATFKQQNEIVAALNRVTVDLTGNPDGAGLSNAVTQCQQAALALQKVALKIAISEAQNAINIDQALKSALQAQLAALP